jgi:Putative Tad-like Flp pilus-assembly
MTYRQKEAGQALIIVVLGIVVLIGALGLGIDMAGAQAYVTKPALATVQQAANLALTNNGYGSSSGTTAIINNPPSCTTGAPCNLPATDPNLGKPNYVEVVLTQNQPTFFSKIFGVSSVPLRARAEAEANNNCIYTLAPSGAGITVLAAGVSTACGIVDESSSAPGAFDCLAGILVAPSLEMVGTPNDFLCFTTTAPRTGITLPSTPYDPMKYLQSYEPATTPCGASVASPYTGHNGLLTINTAGQVLNPGIYCGGINFNSGGNATLNAGTYVITGGNLTFNPGTSVNGSAGVTFYLNTGGFNFNFTSFAFGGLINLQAPTTGSVSTGNYPGILFFQPPTNVTASQVVGSFAFGMTVDGGYYMPSATLTYFFDFVAPTTGAYAPIVVNRLQFGLTAFLGAPPVYIAFLPPTGVAPLASNSAILVE